MQLLYTCNGQCKCPCKDLIYGRANPLENMEVLGTPNNGIGGGRFGMGRGRMHWGLDLKTDIGAPIYAMFDAKVTFVRDCFDPNIPYSQYETEYFELKQTTRDAGNMIILENANTGVSQIFMHLNEVIISPGNKMIPAGTLIGYAGATGSAGAKTSSGAHLHLGIKTKNEGSVNPEEYLYAKFDTNGKNINPC